MVTGNLVPGIRYWVMVSRNTPGLKLGGLEAGRLFCKLQKLSSFLSSWLLAITHEYGYCIGKLFVQLRLTS